MSGLDLATRCIQEVVPEAGAGARVIMEAGYVLLGAMCVALPQDVMDVSQRRRRSHCSTDFWLCMLLWHMRLFPEGCS